MEKTAEEYLSTKGFSSGDVLEVEWCRRFMEDFSAQRNKELKEELEKYKDCLTGSNNVLFEAMEQYQTIKHSADEMAKVLDSLLSPLDNGRDYDNARIKQAISNYKEFNK